MPLGECIKYEIAPNIRLKYIKQWSPKGIESADLQNSSKRMSLWRIYNVDLYYIESIQGRGDEYYFE